MTTAWTTIGLWGPRARDILASVTSDDVSHEGFPFGRCRTIEIGSQLVLASRISYVGDLGWELYVPIEQGARLWDVLWEAGAPHSLTACGIGVYGTTGRLEKGYRAYGAELETEYNVVEAGMERPNVKEQDFVGKEAHLRHREEEPAAILCTLTIDDHTSAAGVKRYPLGREPITLRDGTPLTDAKGRRSYVTSAGAGPSLGKYILMAYLPPEQAVEGSRRARGRVHERALPGHRRRRRRDRALRSRECEDPLVKVLVCVKRVPMTGGRIVLTEDALAIETKHLGFAVSPHEECGVEEAVRLVEQHGGESVVLDARPGRCGGAAARCDGDRHRPGHPPRHRRRGVGSRGDRGCDRRRRSAPTRPPRGRSTSSSSGTSRPTPVASRSACVPPMRSGRPCATGLKSVVVEGGIVRCEQEIGGGRDVYELPLPAVRHRARRAQPAALPVRAGPDARGAQAARGDDADAAASRGSSCRGSSCRRARRGRPRCSAMGRRRPRPSSTCSSRSGWRRESRSRRARRRRRHRRLAAGARARGAARRRDARAADRAWRCRGGGRACRSPSRTSPSTPALDAFAPDAWAAIVCGVAERIGATAVVAPGTGPATDAMARAAVRLGEPLAANVTAVTPGTPLSLTRMRWGGSLLEEARAALAGGRC